MSDTQIMIIAAECRSACADEPDLETRVVKAMRKVSDSHWSGADEDHRFRGALGAVLQDPLTTDDERERIEISLNALRAVSAMMSGIPVDMARAVPDDDGPNPLPLMGLWHKACGDA